MNFPANPTEDEYELAWNDAGDLIKKFDWLTGRSVLARLLTGTYRNPPGRPGPEFRDDEVVSEDVARQALQVFRRVQEGVRELHKMTMYQRKLTCLAFETIYMGCERDLIDAVLTFSRLRVLPVPRTNALAYLRSEADVFARFVLLVTNKSALLFDEYGNQSEHRNFFGEVMVKTGWSLSEEETDAVWAFGARSTYGQAGKSAGLRLTNQERAEIKKWYTAQGLT